MTRAAAAKKPARWADAVPVLASSAASAAIHALLTPRTLERHPDDRQPPRQPVEGERADVALGVGRGSSVTPACVVRPQG